MRVYTILSVGDHEIVALPDSINRSTPSFCHS